MSYIHYWFSLTTIIYPFLPGILTELNDCSGCSSWKSFTKGILIVHLDGSYPSASQSTITALTWSSLLQLATAIMLSLFPLNTEALMCSLLVETAQVLSL